MNLRVRLSLSEVYWHWQVEQPATGSDLAIPSQACVINTVTVTNIAPWYAPYTVQCSSLYLLVLVSRMTVSIGMDIN